MSLSKNHPFLVKNAHVSVNHPAKGCYLSSERDAAYEITDDEVEFGKAMERHKRRYRRTSLTMSEVLYIAKGLGYTKS